MSVITENGAHTTQQSLACRFCQISARERPVVESPIGIAVPSIGAFVEGWLLVIPRRHVVALSDLTERERGEFHALMDEAHKLISRKYGRTVMFEHGPAGPARNAGCGVDHAHLHTVPLPLVLHETVKTDGDGRELQWRPADLPWDADAEHSARLDYFFVREADGTAWIASTPAAPSQLLRRAIAEYVRTPTWDWKADFRHELVAATYRRLLDSSNPMVRE